jgi:hypothetical protein
MKGDKEIFKAIIEPLIVDPISEALKKQRLEATSTTDILEIDELPDPVITPLNRYWKLVLISFQYVCAYSNALLIIWHFSSSLSTPTHGYIL